MIEVINSLVESFNTKKFENISQLIHPDIVMTTFSMKTGKLVYVKGKENYLKAINNNFGPPSNLTIIIKNTIIDKNKASVSGFYEGNMWELLKLDKIFQVRFSADLELKDNLIIKHDKYLDTLELLRLSGNSIFQENKEEKIKAYLNKLIRLGIIPKK